MTTEHRLPTATRPAGAPAYFLGRSAAAWRAALARATLPRPRPVPAVLACPAPTTRIG